MDKTPEKMSSKEDLESFRLWLMNLMGDLTNLTLQMFYTYNFISEVLKDDPLVKGMAAEFEEASMKARLCAEECIAFLISNREKTRPALAGGTPVTQHGPECSKSPALQV